MPLSVNCPGCREPLEVDDEYRAWTVRCPRCGREFRPADADAADYPSPPPSRRQRRRRPSDREVVERARARVAGPASWLRVVGVVGVLSGVAGLGWASFLLGDPAEAKRVLNTPNEQEAVTLATLFAGCSGFVVLFGGLVAYGAIKMGRLESYGWGVASAVLAISTILFCTCCLVTGVPLGVWALAVISDRDVRDAFDIVAERCAGRSRFDDDEE